MFTHVTHSSNFPFYKVNFWSIFPLNWNIELSFFSNSDITSFIFMPNMSIHFHEADCSSCLPWGFWSWLVWECPDQLATGRRGVAACHSSKWPLSEKFTQSLKKNSPIRGHKKTISSSTTVDQTVISSVFYENDQHSFNIHSKEIIRE